MFADILKEKFPQDERNGLYKTPQLPAVKLSKLLIRDTRIASPSDVVALHLNEGTFSSTALIFTKDTCYYDGGSFPLGSVREVQAKGAKLTVFVNQNADLLPHSFAVKNETVATILQRLLESLGRVDPAAEKAVQRVYEGFSDTELNWLNLRDEIMRTIDLLYDKYNDGKISLLDYEMKKEDLLKRL
jgi:hypothetical protein